LTSGAAASLFSTGRIWPKPFSRFWPGRNSRAFATGETCSPPCKYLPDEYQEILSNGAGQWEAIRNATFEISESGLSPSSDAVQAFEQNAKQAAINRASAEMAYRTSSQRFNDIQVLLNRVNTAPDAKDIADLQARIQAEQVMMQNEANKLQALALLMAAQRDLQDQQAKEIRMNSGKGPMPKGW
jgi:type IV secretion system protein VirB5